LINLISVFCVYTKLETVSRRKNSGGFKSSNFDFFFDRNQNIFRL
jgi:hypothetical protein